MSDPDLYIRGRRTVIKTPRLGVGGGGGGAGLKKKFFGPSGPVWSKNKGAGAGSRASSLDPPLVIALVTSH